MWGLWKKKNQKKAEIHVMDNNNGQGGLAGMDDAMMPFWLQLEDRCV